MKVETRKELANTVTHAIGLIAFVTLIPIMFVKAAKYELDGKLLGLILFSVGLVAVYTSSTVYHAIMHEKTKRFLRVLDHISIYFLIAGSYSAFMTMFMPQSISHPFLYILWGIVAVGIVKKIFFTGRFEILSTGLYVFLGCMGLFLGKYLFQYIPTNVIWMIFLGGASYLFGVIFYAWKGYRYHHAVWHVFVFGGSMLHFLAVFFGLSKM